MNIGIIIYSQTGNTLSVAQRLEKALMSKGHTVSIERVEIVKESMHPELKAVPDTAAYDALIFASPVHAFTLSAPMKAYLAQIPDISGKKVYCYVTMQLRQSWMGGKRSIRKITKTCKSKGADIILSGIVHWSDAEREKQIDDLVTAFSTM